MDTIRVKIGKIVTFNGRVQDDRQEVEFQGECLGSRTEYGYNRGFITDTRGVTQTLYRAVDGRLIVHIHEWSRWQGEPDNLRLVAVTEADLWPGGKFSLLGAACGFGGPLTLDQALK